MGNERINNAPKDMREIYKEVVNILKLLNNQKNEANQIYHYTSTKVMNQILKSGVFWASHLFYLNDATEYKNGISQLNTFFEESLKKHNYDKKETISKTKDNLIEKIKDRDGKNFKGIYSISFSLDEDNLHQWNTYAKESGICIALDYDVLNNCGENDRISLFYLNQHEGLVSKMDEDKEIKLEWGADREEYANASELINQVCYGDWKIELQDILECFARAIVNSSNRRTKSKEVIKEIYDDNSKEYNENFKEFCNTYGIDSRPKFLKSSDLNLWEFFIKFDEYAALFFQVLISYTKIAAFWQESEVRAVFHFPEGEFYPDIKYFEQESGILRPYVEIYFIRKNEEGEEIVETPILPVYSILVGPSGRQQAVFDSVVHRIRYGNNRVWNYVNESIKKEEYSQLKSKFDKYADAAIQEWKVNQQHNVDNKGIEGKIKIKLFEQWLEEVVGVIEIDELKESIKVKLKEVFNEICLEKVCEPENDNLKPILQYIEQNHFFSKEGIWIKKSKIPYIFS